MPVPSLDPPGANEKRRHNSLPEERVVTPFGQNHVCRNILALTVLKITCRYQTTANYNPGGFVYKTRTIIFPNKHSALRVVGH